MDHSPELQQSWSCLQPARNVCSQGPAQISDAVNITCFARKREHCFSLDTLPLPSQCRSTAKWHPVCLKQRAISLDPQHCVQHRRTCVVCQATRECDQSMRASMRFITRIASLQRDTTQERCKSLEAKCTILRAPGETFSASLTSDAARVLLLPRMRRQQLALRDLQGLPRLL